MPVPTPTVKLAAIPNTIQSTFGDWGTSGSSSRDWFQANSMMAQQASMADLRNRLAAQLRIQEGLEFKAAEAPLPESQNLLQYLRSSCD